MLSYCLKCRKNTESINPRFLKIYNGQTLTLSKWALRGRKNENLLKNKWNIRSWSNLGLKTLLIKIKLLSDLVLNALPVNGIININEIVNKFLLAADKFMREIVLIVLSDDLLKTNK